MPHLLPRVNFGALDERHTTVQSKEKTRHLTAELLAQENRLQLLQRLAGWLCVESQRWPKSINYRIKKLQLPLFFSFYTEKVYDLLLLLHSFYSPGAAFLEGISALGYSQESPPPTTFHLICYSNASTKLKTARAPTFTTEIPQHQATHASLPGTAGLSPASTLQLPPLTGGEGKISQKSR